MTEKTKSEGSLKEVEKKVLPRLQDARADRATIETFINRVFAYGLPGRRRMGEETKHSVDRMRQHQIYDSELQFTMRESASELKSIYTPRERHWADLAPRESLPDRISKNTEFKRLLYAEQASLYETIRGTRADVALDMAWEDWQVAAGCIEVNGVKGGKRASIVEHVPLPELNMEGCSELPGGVDGRWRTRRIKGRYLKMAFPMVDWDEVFKPPRRALKESDDYDVTHGYRFNVDAWPSESWFLDVFLDETLVHTEARVGHGSVGLIPFRSGENTPSPWGRGPASIALSPAMALDQLAYLTLKVLPKRVDPPFMYGSLGGLNIENAIKAGAAVPAGPEFSLQMIESRHGMDELYTEAEEMRLHIRRALWQDKPPPHEPGTTPPTAFQIQQNELSRAIRQERPRARINPELIIPVLQRFVNIEQRAGRMQPMSIEGVGDPIVLEPKSPLSRAADLEDVQQGQMLLQMVTALLQEQGIMTIDVRATISNFREKLGARLVELLSEEQAMANSARAAGVQQAGAAAGAVAGEQLGAEMAAA